MTLRLALTLTVRLTVRTAIIEHLRWKICNIPSTVEEIAEGIERSPSAVRRAMLALWREGAMIRLPAPNGARTRYMLTDGGPTGARFIPDSHEAP